MSTAATRAVWVASVHMEIEQNGIVHPGKEVLRDLVAAVQLRLMWSVGKKTIICDFL